MPKAHGPHAPLGAAPHASVISLIPNRRPVPPQSLQQLAIRLHHLVQPTDIGVHIGTHSDDLSQMLLHISAQPFPLLARAAQRGQKMKVVMLPRQSLELLAIIKVWNRARPKQQPELMPLMPLRVRQQPVQHRAKRSNPRPRRDQNRVAQRRTQNKTPERPLKRYLRALLQTAQIVRHETLFHPIQAESEMPILARRRRDRIGARHLFPLGSSRLHREPLPGHKSKMAHPVYLKLQVLGKLRERHRANHPCVKSLKLGHQYLDDTGKPPDASIPREASLSVFTGA